MTGVRSARRGEGGFTLIELLIVTTLVAIVTTAIFGVYTVTQRSASTATASEDALGSARSGIDRLAADLRAINAGRQGQLGAITAAAATSLTFLGFDTSVTPATLTVAANAGDTAIQVDNAAGLTAGKFLTIDPYFESHKITAVAGTTVTLEEALAIPYPIGRAVRAIETISYAYAANGTHGTVTRTVGGAADPPLLDNVSSFLITYCDGATPPNCTAPALDQVREIRVEVTTTAVSGSQAASRKLSLSLRPRNLSKDGTGTSGI